MAVIRTPLPYAHFTLLRNCWLRDPRISLKAKGLLGYLSSHTDGYRCSQAQIVRESKDARDAVVTGLRELEGAGYLSRVPTRSAGRFAEDDYALADPFDATGQLLPEWREEGGRETQRVRAGEGRESLQLGFPGTEEPTREIRPIEDQGGEDQGSPPETPPTRMADTVNARARDLAREHYDATGGLAKFQAVQAIVKRALSAVVEGGQPRYTDERVRQALADLRDHGRPVTLESVRAALERSQTVSGGSYRRAAGPYRDPASPGAFDGGF